MQKGTNSLKTVAVSGSTGFIGRNLITELEKEFRILPVGRSNFRLSKTDFDKKMMTADAIINLAEGPIIKRWTRRNKKLIYNSRIDTTRKIAQFLINHQDKERLFIKKSAIGLYGENYINTESDYSLAKGFLKDLILDWESSASTAESIYTKVIILRLGTVLAKDGGMMKILLPYFRMGLGCKMGSGNHD